MKVAFTSDQLAELIESYLDSSDMEGAFHMISNNWTQLNKDMREWLVGGEGVVYQLPKEYCELLTGKRKKDRSPKASRTDMVWVGSGYNIRRAPRYIAEQIAEEEEVRLAEQMKIDQQRKRERLIEGYLSCGDHSKADKDAKEFIVENTPFYNTEKYRVMKSDSVNKHLNELKDLLVHGRSEDAGELYGRMNLWGSISSDEYETLKRDAEAIRLKEEEDAETARLKREQDIKIENDKRRREHEESIRNQQMLERQKRRSYMKLVKSRGITELMHFTRIENLPSILERGIMSRDRLDSNRVHYKYNDTSRYDGFTGASCLSVSFPNSRLLYRFKVDQGGKWAVLSINPAVFESKGVDKYHFYQLNAAKGNLGRCEFTKMFLGRSDKYPEDVQAEILAFGTISPKYIQKIYVENDSIKNDIHTDKAVVTNVGMFRPRGGY